MLKLEQVQAWFQRRRGVEFTGPGAMREVMAATAGIPALVGALDRLIQQQHSAAPTLDAPQTTAVLASLADQFGTVAAAAALDERELDVLRHVAVASLEHGPELAEYIEEGLVEGVDQTDAGVLERLLLLGFLPEIPGSEAIVRSVASLPQEDPVRHLFDLG